MPLDPITAALDIGGKLLDRLFPDPAQRAEAQLKLVELQQSGELARMTAETDLAKAQISVNQTEAASDDKFTRRWRPFIGWVCGVAFAYHFVFQPFLAFVLANTGHDVKLPDFEMETLSQVLFGLLGLGTLRTVEKVTVKGKLPWRK